MIKDKVGVEKLQKRVVSISPKYGRDREDERNRTVWWATKVLQLSYQSSSLYGRLLEDKHFAWPRPEAQAGLCSIVVMPRSEAMLHGKAALAHCSSQAIQSGALK